MQPRLSYPRTPYTAALLALCLLAVAAIACGGDDEDEPSPTATPAGAVATATSVPDASPTPQAPAATATARPEPSQAPEAGDAVPIEYLGYEIVSDFTYAEPAGFPENLMLLVETGCTQCDGPTEALYRVWRNDGETHVELLVDAQISGAENTYITSFAVRPDLAEIVVTVCTDCGGAGRPLIDSPVTVYRSIDGGITWRNIHETVAGKQIFVEAITDEGIVFIDLDGTMFYLRGDVIEPPAGADRLLHDSRLAGELRWLAGDGSTVLDNQGNPIAIVEPGSLIVALAPDGPDWARAAVGWALNFVKGPFEGYAVTTIGPDGRLIGFRSDDYVAPVRFLENGAVLGVMSSDDGLYGGTIGYIDASKGLLTPIHGALIESPFGDGERSIGRNALAGAVSGPFQRVTTDGTACLPIRQSTNSQSRELTCAADGTLVYDLHNTITVGGQQWAKVRLLDGREGFTVTSYLTAE